MSIWTELQAVARQWLPSKSLGERGERVAARYLRKRCRMRIVQRGYSNHIGEIDLIGVDMRSRPRTVVFVEVKTRTDDRFGSPAEAVDSAKQRQITQTSLVWLKQHDLLECRVRFDIVGITWPESGQRPVVRHFADAFRPSGQGHMFF